MKKITLFGPTIVVVAGESGIHHPYENPLTVTNAEAARLVAAGVLASDPEDTEGEDPVDTDPADDCLDGMTVAQLTELANGEGVDLTGLTLKADIIAAIRAHRAAASA
jgi:hypothetical protein